MASGQAITDTGRYRYQRAENFKDILIDDIVNPAPISGLVFPIFGKSGYCFDRVFKIVLSCEISLWL
jgi:hypothetical protein